MEDSQLAQLDNSNLIGKEFLHHLIQTTSPRIALRPKSKCKSEYWRLFDAVELDGQVQPFALCSVCKKLVAYSSKIGTGGLKRHTCSRLFPDSNCPESDSAGFFIKKEYPDGFESSALFEPYVPQVRVQEMRITKDYLQKLIRSQSSRVILMTMTNENGSSWPLYSSVELDGKLQPYVHCSECKALIAYSRKTGASGLSRHMCARMLAIEDKELSADFGILSERFAVKQMTSLTQKVVEFLSKDLQLVEIINGPGFQELAQALINHGADYGRIPINDVLVGHGEISNTHIPDLYKVVKEFSIEQLSGKQLSFSVDSWVEDNVLPNSISVVAHFLDDSYMPKQMFLGIREFDETQMSDTETVQSAVLEIISEFVPIHSLARSVFVKSRDVMHVLSSTDDDNDSQFSTLPCAVHLLNIVMNDILVNSTDNYSEPLKAIVLSLAKRGFDNICYKPLMIDSPLEWLDFFTIIKNIEMRYDEIQAILSEHEEASILSDIPRTGLSNLCDFLTPFKDCYDVLRSENQITLNRFILYKLKLELHCAPRSDDVEVVHNMRRMVLKKLQAHFTWHPLHCLALMLDPRFKSLKMLSDDERKQTLDLLKHMMDNLVTTCTNLPIEGSRSFNEFTGQSERTNEDGKMSSLNVLPRKKARLNTDDFAEFMDEPYNPTEYELQRYIERIIPPNTITEVGEYWNEFSVEFPKIRLVARQVLAIPASSLLPERVRSEIGHLRRKMSRSQLEEIIFLHFNAKNATNIKL